MISRQYRLFVFAAFAALCVADSARAWEVNKVRCLGVPLATKIHNHRRLAPVCAGAISVSDPAGSVAVNLLGQSPSANAARAAWTAWWEVSNKQSHAIWIDSDLVSGPCTSSVVMSPNDLPNKAVVLSLPDRAGRVWRGSVNDCTGNITRFDIDIDADLPPGPTTCSRPSTTQMGTWLHELGHAYGFAHDQRTLNTLTDGTPDFGSCGVSRSGSSAFVILKPCGDAARGFRTVYNQAPPTLVDVGAAPLVKITKDDEPIDGGGSTSFSALGIAAATDEQVVAFSSLLSDKRARDEDFINPLNIEIMYTFINMRAEVVYPDVAVWLVPAPSATWEPSAGTPDLTHTDPGAIEIGYVAGENAGLLAANNFPRRQMWPIQRTTLRYHGVAARQRYFIVLQFDPAGDLNDVDLRDNSIMLNSTVYIAPY